MDKIIPAPNVCVCVVGSRVTKHEWKKLKIQSKECQEINFKINVFLMFEFVYVFKYWNCGHKRNFAVCKGFLIITFNVICVVLITRPYTTCIL